MKPDQRRSRGAGGICELSRKTIYLSHDDAVKAAGEFMNPYICRLCLRWHVGHSTKQRRDERRARLAAMVREAEDLGLYDQPEAKACGEA